MKNVGTLFVVFVKKADLNMIEMSVFEECMIFLPPYLHTHRRSPPCHKSKTKKVKSRKICETDWVLKHHQSDF